MANLFYIHHFTLSARQRSLLLPLTCQVRGFGSSQFILYPAGKPFGLDPESLTLENSTTKHANDQEVLRPASAYIDSTTPVTPEEELPVVSDTDKSLSDGVTKANQMVLSISEDGTISPAKPISNPFSPDYSLSEIWEQKLLELVSKQPSTPLEFIKPLLVAYPKDSALKDEDFSELHKTDVFLRTISRIWLTLGRRDITTYEKQIIIEEITYQSHIKLLSEGKQYINCSPDTQQYLDGLTSSLIKRIETAYKISKTAYDKESEDSKNTVYEQEFLCFIVETMGAETLAKDIIGFALSIHQKFVGHDYESIVITKIGFAMGRMFFKFALQTLLKRRTSERKRAFEQDKANGVVDQNASFVPESFTQFLDSLPTHFKSLYLKEDIDHVASDKFHFALGHTFITMGLMDKIWTLYSSSQLSDSSEKTYTTVRPTDKFVQHMSVLSSSSSEIPTSIPMVFLPKRWTLDLSGKIKEFGGYLWNDTKGRQDVWYAKAGYTALPTFIPNPSVGNPVINLLNGFSAVPYSINKEVLAFILEHNDKLHIYLPYTDSLKDVPFSRKSAYRKAKAEHDRARADHLCLTLAAVYSRAEAIYFPMRSDFRTRVYNECYALSYQGNELAKSLLTFATPGYVSRNNSFAITVLKAYGAGLYSSTLDKQSFQDKVLWTQDNHDRIMNFQNDFEFLNKCEEKKPLFIAWAFEYVKLMEWLQNDLTSDFKTYLPVQLDATCNGLQHLNMLVRNTANMAILNLTSKDMDEKPDDYYSYVVKEIEIIIKDYLSPTEDNGEVNNNVGTIESYKRIVRFNLTRQAIKKSIMVVSYNASHGSMVEYIQESLGKSCKTTYYKEVEGQYVPLRTKVFDPKYMVGYTNADGSTLFKSDIARYVSMYDTFFEKTTPALLELRRYLRQMAYIYGSLGQEIPWTIPSGVIITSAYKTVGPVSYNAFLGLRKRISMNKFLDTLNPQKMARGFMPNVIHSLDACTVALMFKYLLESKYPIKKRTSGLSKIRLDYNPNNIYTSSTTTSAEISCDINMFSIHDCFGTTADNIELLLDVIRKAYIEIYFDNHYLKQFDAKLQQSLIDIAGSRYNKATGKVMVPNNRKDAKSEWRHLAVPSIDNLIVASEIFSPEILLNSNYILK